MEIIVNILARYEIVEYLYLRAVSHTTALLKEAIVKLYTVILDYLLQAHAYFEPHLLKKVTKSIFQSEESTNKFLLSINQGELEVEKYLRLVSDETLDKIDRNMSGLTYSMHTFQGSMQTLQREISTVKLTANSTEHHLVKALKDLETPIQRIASQISDIQDHLKEKERARLFEWLTMVHTSSHHREKLGNLLFGSCQWLLKKKEFEEWMKASTSSILWLHGIPGSGKSMLVCHVIEYLKHRAQQRQDSAPIAYFYCARNINEPERADPTELLRNILEQLCSLDAETPIRKPLSNAYLARKKEARGRKPEKLNLEETVDIILEVLETNPATIVIDGLDECDPIKRNDLLLALQKIITESNSIVKVFVSSRDDHDLVHHLVNSPNLYIHAADNTEDIMMFIRSRVQGAIRDGKLLCGRVSDRLKDIIIGRLIKEANGMFRLVSLHIDSLCDPYRIKTEANVHYALDHLPQELEKSYDVVMSHILQAEDPNPHLASRILKWILCARKALDSTSISQAICVERRDQTLLSIDEILSVCCNLVVYNKETDKFQFSHLSVREYLESRPEYSAEEANYMAAETCLTCMVSSNLHLVRFRRHAEHFWGNYARLAARKRDKSDLENLLTAFLISPFDPKLIGLTRLHSYLLQYEPSLCPLWTKEITTQVLLWTLFLACKYDLSEIVAQLLSRAHPEQAFIEKTRQGLNCAQASGYFNSPLTIDLLYDRTRILLPKELDFVLYWTSAGNVAFHQGNLEAANRIWHKKYKTDKVDTRHKKYCIRPVTKSNTSFPPSYWLFNSLSPDMPQHTLLDTSEQSEKSFIIGASNLFRSSQEYVGVCDKCACSIWRSLDMVVLSISNAFCYLDTVQSVAPIEKELKVQAMAKIMQDLLGNHDGHRCAPDNNSWIVSMLEFIIPLDHNIYDLLTFMHYITEAFLFMCIHEHGHETEISKYSTWYLKHRTFFDDMIRIRRIMNEQKVIDWKVLFLARDIDKGNDYILELLKIRMKIAPEAINVALSNWDKKMVKKLLEYNPVEINNEVIRSVAGNLRHGTDIMELLLLAQEEREASESAHMTERITSGD